LIFGQHLTTPVGTVTEIKRSYCSC